MTQIVWDMDGTVLDSTRVMPDAFIRAVQELGGPAVDRDDVFAAYPLGVPEVILAHLLRRELADGEHEAYYRHLAGAAVACYPGVADVLAGLRRLGHPVVVYTGASTRAASMLFAGAGVEVDLLVGGDQVPHPKPAPDGLFTVAGRLAVAPASLAYVGDSVLDLRAARAAGARSVAAGWGHLYDDSEPADVTLLSPGDVLDLLR